MDEKVAATIALIALIVVGFFAYQYLGAPLAIISVSKVEIYPKTGSVDPKTGEWTGTFWVITGIVNAEESYSFYKFDKAQSQTGDNKIGDKTIVPTAVIEVTLTPGQPYYERALKRTPIKVTPKASEWEFLDRYWIRSGKNIVNPLVVDTWEFSELYWNLYTPFTVTIKKTSGQNQFTKTVSVNTIGGVETIQVVNPYDSKEKLLITNLGKLGTGYEIALDNILMLGNKDYVFRFSDDLKRTITMDARSESYSYYWFGPYRITMDTEIEARPPFIWVEYPGWDLSTTLITPRTPNTFTDDPYSTPRGQSLSNYLLTKGFSLIPKSQLDIWKQGYEITSDNKLRVYLPRASVSSLITLQISTELADSVVYQPFVGEFRITDVKWESGETKPKISDKQLVYVTVKQIADITATGTIWTEVSPSGTQVSVTPKTDTITLGKDQTYTFRFEVMNLGVSKETGIKITFKVTDSLGNLDATASAEATLIVGEATLVVYTTGESPPNSGAIFVNGVQKTRNYGNQYRESLPTSTYTVSFGDVTGFITPKSQTVQLEKGETETVEGKYEPTGTKTVLKVSVIDHITKQAVSSIVVSVEAEGLSKQTEITGPDGIATFDLKTYVGSVKISTAGTLIYASAEQTVSVQLGENKTVIELQQWWQQYWWVIFAIVAVIVVVIIMWRLLKEPS